MAATIYQLGINATSSDKNKKAFNGQFTQGNPTPLNGVDGSILVKDIKFNAQMYSPNSLEVVLSVTGVNLEDYNDIRLSLYKSETTYVAQNYYVVEKKFKITSSAANQREYTLKAYSADYFLTIDKFCQAFTGKTLKDGIVVPTLQNSVSKNFNLFRTLAGEISNDPNAKKDATDYLVINQQNFDEKSIIPYAVQYNESFYDFLMRMCNRDGEFLYFGTDNKLHIGLGNEDEPSSLTDSYTAEFIQTYNTEDTTNWVDPDYLGKLKNKDSDYLGDFNAPITNKNSESGSNSDSNSNSSSTDNQNNQSNIYSYCGVLAPEYLENISEPNAEREDYVKRDEYYTDFSLAASVLRSLFDKKTVSDALISTSLSLTDQFTHINKWVRDYKKDFNDRYSGYLYADNKRTTASYVELYKNLEEVKSYQVKVLGEGVDFPELGSIVVFNNDKYVVYKLDVNFISKKDKYTKSEEMSEPQDSATQQEDSYRQEYKLLLVKGINQTDNTSTSNKFYPLPMLEKRIRKASAQRAIVMDNFDPDRIGRVRVKFPWQKDTKVGDKTITDDNWTPWIRISTPMASKDAGMLFIPTVGDEVLVDFENENVESPYVSGAFYSDSHRPSVLAQSQTNGKVKSITSTNGHHIAFFDNGSAERYAANFLPIMKTISSYGVFDNKTYKKDEDKYFAGGFEISDYHGIYSIKGSTHNRSIDISSPFGNVSIDAFQGITINAPLGDVKIVGKNVSIEARNNLTLESGTNIKNCFGNYVKNGRWQAGKMIHDLGSNLIVNGILGTVAGLIDLSFFRNYLETILRPIGGTMLIKSNRYMRLEAGEGKTFTYDSEKKISHHKFFSTLLNKEQLSPLKYAKEEVDTALEMLNVWVTKLNHFLDAYKHNDFFDSTANIDFFDNRGNMIKLKELDSVKIVGGHQVSTKYDNIDDDSYKNNIKLIHTEISGCFNTYQELVNKLDIQVYNDEVTRLWNAAKSNLNHEQDYQRLSVSLNKSKVYFDYLKHTIENNKELNDLISISQVTEYNIETLEQAIKQKNVASAEEETWQEVLKTKTINSLLEPSGVSGFIELLDDKMWSSKDKGAILLSDNKNTFFKMHNDGTFIKGRWNDYKSEFIEIMSSVNNQVVGQTLGN